MELENIVFSGGAMKSLAFGGVIRAIDKAGLRGQIKRIAATSGGAITACLVACGFTGEEIINIMFSRDFSKLKDNTSLLENIHRLSFNFGFYDSRLIANWISEHLQEKNIDGNITFREVYNIYGVDLIIPATHLNTRETVYFSREETPDMAIIDATRISSSIPVFFEAYKFRKDIYVDGGITCNLPIDIIKNKYDPDMEHTLAFNVINNNDITYYREIDDFIDFINEIINTYFYHYNIKRNTEFKDNIVNINTGEISPVNFALEDKDKITLFKRGYQTTKERLKYFGIDNSIKNLFK